MRSLLPKYLCFAVLALSSSEVVARRRVRGGAAGSAAEDVKASDSSSMIKTSTKTSGRQPSRRAIRHLKSKGGDSKSGKKDASTDPVEPGDVGGDRTDDTGGGGVGGPGIDIPPLCTTLDENTAAALQQAIMDTPVGGTLTLCESTILFEQEVALKDLTAASNVTIECVAGGECIMDGQNQHRLFSIGSDRTLPLPDWSEAPPAIVSGLTFKNLIFQNGLGTLRIQDDGVARQGGGGAFQVTGLVLDSLSFVGCTFRHNSASEFDSGGALELYSVTPFSKVHIEDCTFWNNTAQAGGGIFADDVRINLVGTTFTENNICDKSSGPAILLHETNQMAFVECMGDGNAFIENKDTWCVGRSRPNFVTTDIVGCTKGCGAWAEDSCRIE